MVCCGSSVLTVRKILAMWQDYHLSMAGHRTFKEFSASFPTRTQQDSLREADSGEQNSAPALEKEVPPEYPQVHAWMLVSPPPLLVASDTPSPHQLWVPITLSQSSGGPHPTRGCKPPPRL